MSRLLFKFRNFIFGHSYVIGYDLDSTDAASAVLWRKGRDGSVTEVAL